MNEDKQNELLEITKEALFGVGDPTLHGSGCFMNKRGQVLSNFDVLTSLHKLRSAIEKVDGEIRRIPTLHGETQ